MINELIQVKGNETVTTSLIVAESFNKRHDTILRSIDRLIKEIGLHNFAETPLFEKTHYINEQNKQTYPMYYINRDGFSLLVMGFTGKEALEWKLKYIEAFNKMEERLSSPTLQDNRLEIARLIVKAPDSKLQTLRELYPEYFNNTPEIGSLEYISDLNTSYLKWKEDADITREWISNFPTVDIFNHYVRYCVENMFINMGKKVFYKYLESDFNLTRKQKADGYRYFLTM